MAAQVKTLFRSFAGGVITPEMFGRLDLVKYQTGLAEAENFITLPHGPSANRTGGEYTLEVKDSSAITCLVPFTYSTTQSMVLEIGNLYMRFHTLGGTLLEPVKNITAATVANPGVFTSAAHGYVTGDWVYMLGSAGGFTSLNFRFFKVVVLTANTFSLTDLWGVAINTSTFAAYAAGGTVGRVYEIATPYATADLFALHYTQSADVITITHPTYQQRELRRIAATNWTLTALAFIPTIATPAIPVAVATGAGAINYTYVTTALASGTLEESLASPPVVVANDITIAGQFNTITPVAVATQVRTNIYKLLNGLYGYVGQSDGTGFKDNNITPDMTKTPPLADVVMASATNWPGAVGYYGGRRWFAGTTLQPQNAWGTRAGTESSMNYSIPVRDDDRIAFRIAARQANAIRHIVPLEDLVMLTSSGEWVIDATTGAVLTPTSVDPRPKGSVGASNAQPMLTGQSALYAQDRGGRMREFAYQGVNNGGYRTRDISIMAPHYFDKYTVTQMAFVRAPYPIGWVTRSDGAMLGVTYVPEHQVEAWHSHYTSGGSAALGSFESVCSVPEGSEDVLYWIAQRTINGRTVRYIERQHSRLFATLADCFFVDAGVTYSGVPATVITGGWHLEGQAVDVLADGAVIPNVVIANGGFTLEVAASKVTFGLPIRARFKTLPVSLETQALGQGTQKNVNKGYIRVNESSVIKAGPTYDKLKTVAQRTDEPYGSPPDLVSDEKSLVLSPQWNTNGQICVQQDDPLPITVLSITMDVTLGS